MLAAILLAALSSASRAAPARLPPVEWARFSVLTPAGKPEVDPELMRSLKPVVYATHVVTKGEGSVAAVAKLYGTDFQSLQSTNGNELLLVSPGMKLTVANKPGLLYRVKKEDGELLDDIVRRYRREPGAFRALKQKVIEANGLPGIALLEPYELQPGDAVLIPGITIEFDTYRFPFAQAGWHRISSGFGNRLHPILKYRRMHAGLDLPKPYGTPVYAARSGRVIKAGRYEGYGKMVEIRHTDGASTRYGHLSAILVKDGQWVTRGRTLLGRVGNSGLSTGPHLHFEVRDRNGRALNPRAKIGRR